MFKIKKIILVCSFFLLQDSIFCQTGKILSGFNFGFENKSRNRQLPDGWIKWGTPDYFLKLDSNVKHSGNVSMLIESEARAVKSFGACGLAIPAQYEGKEVEVRAYMKYQDVADGPIGLLLRVDGKNGVLEFDNMQQKNIQGTGDWVPFSVRLPLPNEAKVIVIGAILSGTGKLWVDDFQLLIDGKDISNARLKKDQEFIADKDVEFAADSRISSIMLTDNTIENLTLVGKVWGFLKYYHPAIAKGTVNWDYELFRQLPLILECKNQKERNLILSDWVNKMGVIEEEREEKIDKATIKILPDLGWIEDTSQLGKKLSEQLFHIKNAHRSQENYYVTLDPSIGNPIFSNERPYDKAYPDVGYRLLSLYRYWNIIEYYYPYRYLIEQNWGSILSEYIPKFINAANSLEYRLTVLELICRIKDSHANILAPDTILASFKGKNIAPVEIAFIEKRPVVVSIIKEMGGTKLELQKGDIVLSINHKSIEELFKERVIYEPASNYPTQLRNFTRDLLRTNDTALIISYSRDNVVSTTSIRCYPIASNFFFQKKDTCYKHLANDIAYLNPGNIKNQYLPKIIPDLLKTKGIIIDFRCYPSDFIVFTLSKYLLPNKTSFVWFSKGSISTPGLFTMHDYVKIGEANPNYYKGKVVILVSEITQSSAEYHTMAFRTAPRAMVVGSTTAGADGNVSNFTLPGGIKTVISGIGIYYPDGRETQGVGIIPDIEVLPTIKGIKEGRDELLERAVEVIKK